VAAGTEALAAAYKPEETSDVSWVGVAIPHTGPRRDPYNGPYKEFGE
jgi:hypothetical protein